MFAQHRDSGHLSVVAGEACGEVIERSSALSIQGNWDGRLLSCRDFIEIGGMSAAAIVFGARDT